VAKVRKVGLVAVGVDNPSAALTRLKGAASGAKQVADWLESQKSHGVETVINLLTDGDAAKVSARSVQNAMRTMVDRGDLDVLILYLAGHGIVKSAGDEHVLLSDVDSYKDEAIAVTPTALNVRYSRVPYVLIISDACRSAVDPFGPLGTVAGKPALDLRGVAGVKPSRVDQFFATELSQTAKEFKGEGFFTSVLLEALTTAPANVVEVWPKGDPNVPVITAQKLDDYLSIEVPMRASAQEPSFEQTPDFIVTSKQPDFIAYVDLGDQTRDLKEAPPLDPTKLAALQAMRERTQALAGIGKELKKSPHLSLNENLVAAAGLDEAFRAYVGTEFSRQRFETRTGYSVIGAKVDSAKVSGGRRADVLSDSVDKSRTDVRLYPRDNRYPERPEERGSVAIFFEGGTVSILPVLPGYVGTIHVVDGCIQSLSYEVSEQLRQNLYEDVDEWKHFESRRALAAALSASGKLRSLSKAEGSAHGAFLRGSKRADPTLGIYSAYSYALTGNDEGVVSVNRWFRSYGSLDRESGLRPSPVPFDVAMLARDVSRQSASKAPGIAPFCPLMSLGWSMLPSYIDPALLHPAVIEAGSKRLNSEWTTFRKRDVRWMLNAFEKGELQ
jgi:hypothetical protein